MKFKEIAKRKNIVQAISPSKSSSRNGPNSEKEPQTGATLVPPPMAPRHGAFFECFAFVKVEAVYGTIFSLRPFLNERKVCINHFPTPNFQLICFIIVEQC